MGRVTKRDRMQDGVVSWPQAHSREESVGFAKRLSGMENRFSLFFIPSRLMQAVCSRKLPKSKHPKVTEKMRKSPGKQN